MNSDEPLTVPDTPESIVLRFPAPGPLVEQAYRELTKALHGDEEEKRALGPHQLLARPWDPPTCRDPGLRVELWDWLERFVTWLNHEYVWDTATMIPACWPKHPHLVHEIAGLADHRRRVGQALTGEGLEEWHRYALPAFTDRMRTRLSSHCEDREHQPWPARGRHLRSIDDAAYQSRRAAFEADVRKVDSAAGARGSGSLRLHMLDGGAAVDLQTGELLPP